MSDNNMTPVTFESANKDDPQEFAAWAATYFPDPRAAFKGQLVPFPGVSREFSEQLWRFGFRWHADLMTHYPVMGDQPGAGWLNAMTIVTKAEYETYWAKRSAAPTESPSSDSDAETVLKQMLSTLNPAMAKRIEEMSEAEKAAARPEAEKAAIPAMDRLTELRAAFEQAQQ